MRDLNCIWYIDVSSPEGVPYFKVTLNSYMEKNCTELKLFYDSTKYTKNSTTYLIYILQVHVTGDTEIPYDYIEVTLNSQ